ncbi:hypothetical protein AURDEDRAFT_144098 [Auricularia subglabra TFB-10046 SS5]|nr:hypothetical protein AURDEDRAFT_144098 [Auricularia subglabra TFB-10046 SS5]
MLMPGAPEVPSKTVQPLTESEVFETAPFDSGPLRPASPSSRLPSLKEVNEKGVTFHGSTMLTITGSAIAALSVLPPIPRPYYRPHPSAFGSDMPLSSDERITIVQVLDSLASVCVARDGEAHAVVIVEDDEHITLYHAEDTAPDTARERAANPGLLAVHQRDVAKHLVTVWDTLGAMHKHRSSPSTVDLLRTKLTRLVLERALPALKARFRRDYATVMDLSRILHRTFSREEILRHPQPWRFSLMISEAEMDLIDRTHRLLCFARDHLAACVPGPSIAGQWSALHRDLLDLYQLWFDPKTRKNEERNTYLLHHLEKLLQIPLAQYLRDIVWASIAIDRLCSALRVPSMATRFTKPLKVVYVPNQKHAFLANLDHDELTSRARGLYLQDDCLIDIDKAFQRDWSNLVLAPLQPQFDHFVGTHQFLKVADTHCECTLLACVDQLRPRGLLRYIGLSRYSCLACWEHFCSFNDLLQNLRPTEGAPPLDGRYTYPWHPILTRITDMRVELPWAVPSMRSDGNGLVSLCTQTTLLCDLMAAFDRKRIRVVLPIAPKHDYEPPPVDTHPLFPVGVDDLVPLSRV